jgi:hypothetical protein
VCWFYYPLYVLVLHMCHLYQTNKFVGSISCPLRDADSASTNVMKKDCPYLKYCNSVYKSKSEPTFQNQLQSLCVIQLIYFLLTLHTSTLSVAFTLLFANNFLLHSFIVVFLFYSTNLLTNPLTCYLNE